ncbi:hypothetical protein V1279_002981 [Bradyrhizobium sp. AZCC 1610]|uniref:hypothetical protein n=1 Tax=Bradyrhizobium sp. AZCC 1610 TaxID=3117020 RepID=UPI002FEFEED0
MSKRKSFLYPQELGITYPEYKALIEIRELFANNKFDHDQHVDMTSGNGFNMNCIVSEGECGTTACIGGWMFLAMERDRTLPVGCFRAFQYVQSYRSAALGPLFFPFCNREMRDLLDQHGQNYDFPFELVTPAMALQAIDNFLTTGNPNWPEVTGLLNIEVEHVA